MPVAERRDVLLEAALRVIASRGVARASVRAITAAASMPVASFHVAFASRDAMLAQLVEAVVADQQAAAIAAVAAAEDLRTLVVAALDGWLDGVLADPDAEVVLHELLTWSRFEAAHLATAIYARYESAVLGLVEVARDRLGVTWRVPDAEVARVALVVTDGVAARWLVDRDERAARRALRSGAEAVLALAGAS